ncbi:MAG: hypothetical protein AMJ43_01050 [Coxiella sp. DG_40]|nr:MAG: hypothetical protein AMJ43_01050 [Coxiella sp. DG_40]
MNVFSVLKKTARSEGLISIQITPIGIALVYFSGAKTSKNNFCEFFQCNDLKLLQKHLSQFVIKHDLKGADCIWILHPSYYRLLLIDAPKVPKNERRSAASWQIKDMIDIPLEDLSVEVFSPAKDVIVQSKKLYVVAARKSYLQSVIDLLDESKLHPVSINIHELAVNSLLSMLSEAQEKIMFLQILDNISVFIIVKNNCVHFIHHAMYGIGQLSNSKLFDNFIADVKRCFDYYQHQLEQNIPNKLFLAPLSISNELIVKKLTQALGIEIEHMDVNSLAPYFDVLSNELQASCCAAIGGALNRSRSDAKY